MICPKPKIPARVQARSHFLFLTDSRDIGKDLAIPLKDISYTYKRFVAVSLNFPGRAFSEYKFRRVSGDVILHIKVAMSEIDKVKLSIYSS